MGEGPPGAALLRRPGGGTSPCRGPTGQGREGGDGGNVIIIERRGINRGRSDLPVGRSLGGEAKEERGSAPSPVRG